MVKGAGVAAYASPVVAAGMNVDSVAAQVVYVLDIVNTAIPEIAINCHGASLVAIALRSCRPYVTHSDAGIATPQPVQRISAGSRSSVLRNSADSGSPHSRQRAGV